MGRNHVSAKAKAMGNVHIFSTWENILFDKDWHLHNSEVLSESKKVKRENFLRNLVPPIHFPYLTSFLCGLWEDTNFGANCEELDDLGGSLIARLVSIRLNGSRIEEEIPKLPRRDWHVFWICYFPCKTIRYEDEIWYNMYIQLELKPGFLLSKFHFLVCYL